MKPKCARVQFLQNDYANRLINICGMEGDPSAVCYLRGMSLTNDITADNYRDFSGEDGQWYLYRCLCREQDFASLFQDAFQNDESPCSTEETPEGPILRIASSPGMRAGANIELNMEDDAVKKFILNCLGGLELGTAIVYEPKTSR